MMQPEQYVYVEGAAARAAWTAWTDALGARVDHEMSCRDSHGGCGPDEQYCLTGWDLLEIEQAAHQSYRTTMDESAVAA